MDKNVLERRNNLDILISQMKIERNTFWAYWRDLADNIAPTRPRFLVTNTNKGERKNQKIIDSTGSLAARTLRSGMMAGVTSPARPWFKLGTPDLRIGEQDTVRRWLSGVTNDMNTVFLKSNLYNALPTVYGDMGIFGTGCLFMEEDMDKVVHFYAFPIGSYLLANDHQMKVKVFAREFRLTVRQVIEKFGMDENGEPINQLNIQKKPKIYWDNLSTYVREQYGVGNMEAWVDLTHCIQPNPDYDPQRIEPKFRMYSSVYYESGGGATTLNRPIADFDRSKFLRDSGYSRFPVLAPRWETTGEDVYGTNCPGMESLGDIKQLQIGEKRTMQAIDKILNPPMTGPSTLKKKNASLLPGDITFVDTREGQNGFQPVFQVDPRILEIENKQQQVRQRISRVFYEDLFLMMANSDRRNITATEIEERHEEKLLALGPVLEQLNQDLLDPLIENTFGMMVEQGRILPPPEEVSRAGIKVEYISVMAQAQKLVGLSGLERFTGFAMNLGQVDPGVINKLNLDQLIDVYGDMTSVPPSVIRSDEEVAKIREEQAKAQQAQAQMEAMTQGSQAIKNVKDVPPEQLQQLLGGGGQPPQLEAVEGGI